MMKLSTMWNVDSTVDENGSSPVAEQILVHWEHDEGSVRFFRSSANFVYRFHKDGQAYFLRFADSEERMRDTIEGEIDIINWMVGAGLDVAMPVRSKNGNFVETTITDRGVFHAVVFRGLEGTQLDIEELDDTQFRAWGAALGQLHAALKGYTGLGLAARGTWCAQLEWARAHIPENELAVRHELDQLASALDVLPMNHESYGLIHYDFELDNLVWHEGSIAMLDFDDCAHYWYVADIAFALRDLFANDVDLDTASFWAFVDGYALHCPLDRQLLSQIPLFLRMSQLMGYAKLARALDLPADQAYPAWLEALNLKLKRRMETYALSLAAQAN